METAHALPNATIVRRFAFKASARGRSKPPRARTPLAQGERSEPGRAPTRAPMELQLRRATEADLPDVHEIWRTAAGAASDRPPRDVMLSLFRHELATGAMWIAAGGDGPIGYAAVVTRGAIGFLAEMFVLPAHQSGGVGSALLRCILAEPVGVYCTMSSRDPRALTLYARAGWRPRWPHFLLRRDRATPHALETGGIRAVVADPLDAGLTAWDARIGGRVRPEDHAYWREVLNAVPLWFRRGGVTAGYGYVWRLPAAGGGARVGLGPVGASSPGDAVHCVAAALQWIANESGLDATSYHVAIPGPHPVLIPLLRAGFRIRDVETFCCSSDDLFFDPAAYLGLSGLEGTSFF
jgi:GNAT superfamily N-acetyltransferase